MMCHVHPHVDESWKLSVHVNNGVGLWSIASIATCHPPVIRGRTTLLNCPRPKGCVGYLTKDTATSTGTGSRNWSSREVHPQRIVREVPSDLFQGITDEGIIAHLHYDENVEELDLQCISCHLDAGHYNPNYCTVKWWDSGLPVRPRLIRVSSTRRPRPLPLS